MALLPAHLTKRTMLGLYAGITALTRPLFTEETQVTGIDNLEGKVNSKWGALWLGKHDAMMDGLNLPPLWFQLPGLPSLRGVSRTEYIKISTHPTLSRYLSSALSWVMRNTIFHEVHRTSLMADLPRPEVAGLREQNKRTILQLQNLYRQGIHIAIMPEGTTKTDGRISAIKSGAYDLCQPDVQIIPFGNTYDFMSGDKNIFGHPRDLVFVNFGMPFYYQHVAREHREPDLTYRARDKANFCRLIQDQFMDLNTLTTSQLAGEYVVHLAAQGEKRFTRRDLERVVSQRVNAFRQMKNVVIDRALLDSLTAQRRMDCFYQALQERGYMDGDGTIRAEKALLVPDDIKVYKRQNPLRYMTNRLIGIAEARPAVAEVLRETKY